MLELATLNPIAIKVFLYKVWFSNIQLNIKISWKSMENLLNLKVIQNAEAIFQFVIFGKWDSTPIRDSQFTFSCGLCHLDFDHSFQRIVQEQQLIWQLWPSKRYYQQEVTRKRQEFWSELRGMISSLDCSSATKTKVDLRYGNEHTDTRTHWICVRH